MTDILIVEKKGYRPDAAFGAFSAQRAIDGYAMRTSQTPNVVVKNGAIFWAGRVSDQELARLKGEANQ